jgi:hypothetical protein
MANNDYILRIDAKKALTALSAELDAETVQRCIEAMNIPKAADVEPKQRWIPVTEGLPKRPENWPRCELRRCYFLVALESGCVKSLGFEFATMEWNTVGSPVTHWRPLPEPPKGEDDAEVY